MVQVLAFLLLVVLLVSGWNQSFKEHYARLRGEAPSVSRREVVERVERPVNPVVPQATPARSTSWMFRETSMDGPYGKKRVSQ